MDNGLSFETETDAIMAGAMQSGMHTDGMGDTMPMPSEPTDELKPGSMRKFKNDFEAARIWREGLDETPWIGESIMKGLKPEMPPEEFKYFMPGYKYGEPGTRVIAGGKLPEMNANDPEMDTWEQIVNPDKFDINKLPDTHEAFTIRRDGPYPTGRDGQELKGLDGMIMIRKRKQQKPEEGVPMSSLDTTFAANRIGRHTMPQIDMLLDLEQRAQERQGSLTAYGTGIYRRRMDEITPGQSSYGRGNLEQLGRNTFNREVRRSPADGTFRSREEFANNWEAFTAPRPIQPRPDSGITQMEYVPTGWRQVEGGAGGRRGPNVESRTERTFAPNEGLINFKTSDGKEGVIEYVYRPGMKQIYVNWMGEPDIGNPIMPHELGLRRTRELLRVLSEAHPEATTIAGFRVSGARDETGIGPARATMRIPGRGEPVKPNKPEPKRMSVEEQSRIHSMSDEEILNILDNLPMPPD